MIVEQLIAPVSGLLDKFIPDADQKAKLAHEIATLSEKQHQEIMLQQIELAKIEAQGSMLQRTWRPMIGHCCWVGLAYNVIISPFLGIWLPVPESGFVQCGYCDIMYMRKSLTEQEKMDKHFNGTTYTKDGIDNDF